MKVFKSILLLFVALATVLSTQSCKNKDECDDVICQNGGFCQDGTCICPIGYAGPNCELFDPCKYGLVCENGGTCIDGACDCPEGYSGTKCEIDEIQVLLNNGQTPKALFDGGTPLSSLYGKVYKGGAIFFLDVDDEYPNIEGMVASGVGVGEWGCYGTDIPDLDNVNSGPEGAGAEIGDGANNTNKILNANCMSSNGYKIAATLCRNKGDEWFLPSIRELELWYTNSGSFFLTSYLSSTEVGGNKVWIVYGVDGDLGRKIKDSNTGFFDSRVIAVRVF